MKIILVKIERELELRSKARRLGVSDLHRLNKVIFINLKKDVKGFLQD